MGDKVIEGNCHGILGEERKLSLGQVQNVVDEVLDVDCLVLVRVNRLSKQFVELLAPLSLIFFASACSKVCFLLNSSISVGFATSPTNLDPKRWLLNVLNPECSILSRTRTSFGFVSLI